MIGLIFLFGGLIVVSILIYLSLIDGSFEVKRSQTIHVAPSSVFKEIKNFKTWPLWNPWVIHETEAAIHYSDHPDLEGSSFKWVGKHIGQGKITHIEFQKNKKIKQRVEFVKPFKSHFHFLWNLEAKGKATKITWSMYGKMPFFFRPMARKMDRSIGRDYEYALNLLNRLIDPKAKTYKIDYGKVQEMDAFRYLYRLCSGSLEEITQAMVQEYPQLIEFCQQKGLEITHPPLCLYKKMKKKQFVIHIAVAVKHPNLEEMEQEIREKQYQIGTFPVCKALKITLYGPYDHLEQAWFQAYCHCYKIYRYRAPKNIPCFEQYENDPRKVKPDRLVTGIYLPVK